MLPHILTFGVYFSKETALNCRKYPSVMRVYVPQNRLEEIMHRRKMTQRDLHELTGISQNDISKIINDRKDIYLKTAQRIARALELRVDDIWPYY